MAEFVVDFYSEHDGVRCEEVVRCRECGWFKPDSSDHEHRSGWWCKWWGTDLARPDKFCAWGKRRDDG